MDMRSSLIGTLKPIGTCGPTFSHLSCPPLAESLPRIGFNHRVIRRKTTMINSANLRFDPVTLFGAPPPTRQISWVHSITCSLPLATVLFRSAGGSFSFPTFAFSAFLMLGAVGMVLHLRKAVKVGRIRFSYSPRTAPTIQFDVERSKNPTIFWICFAVYCFMSCAFLTFAFSLALGLFPGQK